MTTCSYCQSSTPVGRGLRVFNRDGSSKYYCSRKCEVNSTKLNRKPGSRKWMLPEKAGKSTTAAKGASAKKA